MTRAYLLGRLGRTQEARAAYDTAIGLTVETPVHCMLERMRARF